MDKKILKIAQQEVEKLKDLLGVEATIECKMEEAEDDLKVLNIVFGGENLGYMIGNRGKHLDALQYVLGNIIRNKVRAMDETVKLAVNVDVAGYKQERNERIEKLAMQKADDARILGEPLDLLPMSAADRRVVHTTLSKFDDVTTESQGEGWDRFVRIIPKTEKEIGVAPTNEGLQEEE
jgi:spoIIIJ-associated protein